MHTLDAATVLITPATKNFSDTAYGLPIRDQSHLAAYIGLIPGCVALFAFVLRVFARLPCCGGTWGYDDWAMLATMVLSLHALPPHFIANMPKIPMIPITVLAPVLAHEGIGRDMWTLPHDSITRILKVCLNDTVSVSSSTDSKQIYYFDELFYITCTALTKISILFFYLRIFPNKTFRRWAHAMMVLNVLYILAFLPAAIFQCVPIRLAWERWDGTHNGTCLNLNSLAWSAAAINIVLDIAVICLPLRRLTHLKMSRLRKAGILFMFLGGGL